MNRNRRNSLGAVLKKPFYKTIFTSPDSDPTQGVDLVGYAVASQSRTDQDEATIEKLESRVISMLAYTVQPDRPPRLLRTFDLIFPTRLGFAPDSSKNE